MGSISLRNLGAVANIPLFNDLSLTIHDGDRVGLIAGNGGGKTTLLKMIAGHAAPTSGDVVCSRGLRIAFVEQDIPETLLDRTLRDAVLSALPPEVRATDGWRAEVVLDDLDAPEMLRDRRVSELSGGWQRLMLIARAWVNDPDALLLDEPTNHLDLGKVFQLQAWLQRSVQRMPVVIASHDREFLDATTNRTLFLRPGGSRYLPLAYSAAREALDQSDAADESKLERDLKDARQLRRQAAKLTNIGVNSGSDLLTVKAKQLKQRAAKIEAAAKPPHREHAGDIKLGNSGLAAKVLLALQDVEVTAPDGRLLFRIGKLNVFQGDRIVLLGGNGVGKTQFVRLLHRAMTGEPAPGIRVTPSLVLGFTDQDMRQLPDEETPETSIGRFGVGDARARALLAAAGFPPEKQTRPTRELSRGQRARLAMLVLRLTEPNFYLMDEPTNHVDIPGREALESEIVSHGATAVLVSHDRRLVRNVGTRFLTIERGRLVEDDDPDRFFALMASEGAGR